MAGNGIGNDAAYNHAQKPRGAFNDMSRET